MPAAPLLLLLAVQSPAAESLRVLALRLPESALVLEAQARPLAVREALSEAFARHELEAARRLAAAYAAAWQDSFLVREVARFTAWPAARRAAKVRADSIRRAGITVYGRDGARAAIAVWRSALARAAAIGDTTGMAAVLGNIGAGFLEEGDLDSAEAYLERARALAVRIGDRRVEANALGSLAGVAEELNDLGLARERIALAVALRERIGDTRGLAADRNNLGLLAQSAGDLDEARRQLDAALALNRRDGRDDVAATNLVNLAALESLKGDFGRAEDLYREALNTWRGQDMWAEAADALYGLGQLEVRRGDYPAARAALLEALAIFRRTGSAADVLDVQVDLATVLSAEGDLQGALDVLRRAEALADSAGATPEHRAGIALTRGDLAVQLNALDEAERFYARAEAWYREAGQAAGQAQAQEGRGFLFLERENHARAHTLLEGALRTLQGAGDRRGAALTRLSLGRLAQARADTAGARAHLLWASNELDAVGDPVAGAWALGKRAALEAEAGFPAAGRALYTRALEQLGDHAAPDVEWQLRAGLGATLRAQGLLDGAAHELRAAVAAIERSSRTLALAERRSGFRADKWEVYAELALVERGRGRPGAAFEVSEQLRAREMFELLGQGRVRAPPGTPADLVQREQDLRRRITELTTELEGRASGAEGLRGPDVSTAGGATREALLRAQAQYADLLLEVKERAPRHAELLASPVVSWQAIARRLAPAEALVEYLVSDSGSVAFVLRSDTLAVVDLGVGRRDLARLVEFARGTLDPARASVTDSLWRGPLQRLHAHLIAPLEAAGFLSGITRLVLVPHGELHYLPFAALLAPAGGAERGRFLMEQYDLLVAPSASVWLMLSERSGGKATGGILAFAPKTEALPATWQEVTAIARLVGQGARVVTGSAATEEVLRRDGAAHRVIHLATYGVLNKQNPLFSFVDLAAGGGQDGRLDVHEVFGLSLDAELVVLSACQTALGSGRQADVPPGDDWVGLTRAFLHAGASRVVATLWPVADQATAVLMERFYQRFTAGADPARALAEAQRALLAARATAHPFYWAGFVTVGSADGTRP